MEVCVLQWFYVEGFSGFWTHSHFAREHSSEPLRSLHVHLESSRRKTLVLVFWGRKPLCRPRLHVYPDTLCPLPVPRSGSCFFNLKPISACSFCSNPHEQVQSLNGFCSPKTSPSLGYRIQPPQDLQSVHRCPRILKWRSHLHLHRSLERPGKPTPAAAQLPFSTTFVPPRFPFELGWFCGVATTTYHKTTHHWNQNNISSRHQRRHPFLRRQTHSEHRFQSPRLATAKGSKLRMQAGS